MTLGQILSGRMEALGYTGRGAQVQLAGLLAARGVKVSPQSISAWLGDHRRPDLHRLIALLDALQVFGEARELAIRLAALPTIQPQTTPNAAEAV